MKACILLVLIFYGGNSDGSKGKNGKYLGKDEELPGKVEGNFFGTMLYPTTLGGFTGAICGDAGRCNNPPLFCPLTSCCMPNGECGCAQGGGKCEEVKSYRVQGKSCSFDGLRVQSDYQVGLVKKASGRICKGQATAFLELNEDGELGIRLRTIICWNSPSHLGVYPGDWQVVMGHTARIEDPDGYLVEKFMMRIFESVDLAEIMGEFGEEQIWEGKTLEELKKMELSKVKEYFKGDSGSSKRTTERDSKWGCDPEPPSISLTPSFVAAAMVTLSSSDTSSCSPDAICSDPPIACPDSSCCIPDSHRPNDSVYCGCYDNSTSTCDKISTLETAWRGNTDDGMVLASQAVNVFPLRSHQCRENYVSVTLEPDAQQDWSLSIQISQCIPVPSKASLHHSLSEGNTHDSSASTAFPDKPQILQFTGNLVLAEGSIYQRMVNICRQYMFRRLRNENP